MQNPSPSTRRADRRKLPIGIQTFRKMREENCYYVDKTAYIQRLVDEGTHYFLSRPRRFGKSLFLDTLKELFEGNESLFEGLHIHDHWDWSVHHPVIRLSFGSGNFKEPGYLQTNLMAQLDAVQRREAVKSEYATAPERFAHLIEALHERVGQPVVVLVDEYDKPILDALDVPEIARANRDFLRGLYATIKDSDAHVRFTFLTGVSKFSKVHLFSGLNNLTDITMDPRYSAVCGYTEADLDAVFAPELLGLDRDKIRDWYNGYSWLGEEKVYNPFDILLLFRRRSFEAYWFETGTPTFLIETLFKRRVSSLELDEMIGSSDLLSTFDVDEIATEALLFQTGYLTITGEESLGGESLYRLGYPNREVRQSLNRSLLRYLVKDPSRQMANSVQLYRLLEANDFEGLKTLFHAFFASIPYEWYTNNDIANYEGYYASVFYSYFAALGLDITVEDSSSHGCLDMAVLFNGNVYLFEFKVVEMAPKGAAMAQLKARRYADKYHARGEPIHLIAVEFSRESRNIAAFEVASA
ncbi:MAG: AAA family ATPase [Gemmatimonadetes bacterium]|nr:AAA family ATPase [Gemmatimonadota bacterium]